MTNFILEHLLHLLNFFSGYSKLAKKWVLTEVLDGAKPKQSQLKNVNEQDWHRFLQAG